MSISLPAWIGSLVFGAIAIVGASIPVYFLVRQIRWLRTTASAEGVVVETVVERREERTYIGDLSIEVCCSTRVRFRAATGAEITFRSDIGSGKQEYETGAKVPVRYDPKQPEKAEIDGFGENWLTPLVFGGMGALLVIVGVYGIRATGSG